MRIYIAKRLLFFIPGIILVVLMSFILLHYSPGDPVERILNDQGIYGGDLNAHTTDQKLKQELTEKLGLNLPLFYFSLSSLSEKENRSSTEIQNWKNYFPAISFQGQNQFHRWLFGDNNTYKGILRGDLGISWATKENVSSILSNRMKWSFLFAIISVILAYLISIPTGLYAAANPDSGFSKWTTIIFSILFSLPSFWFATLLMLLFCNPDILNILPSSGVGLAGGFPMGTGTLNIFLNTLPYLILPTICYTYSSLAFLSGSIRVSLEDVLKEDYIRTARAKGLNEKKVLYKHALRNALLPMITIFSHVLPFAVSGSVILETIFTIPGMGQAIFFSLSAQDYPVIINVFMITGIFTMTSFLLGDILYALVDPRISFTQKSQS